MTKKLFLSVVVVLFYFSEISFAQKMNLALDSGIEKGRIHLEQFLDRADVFKENQRWREMANEGLYVAMAEWEKFSSLEEISCSRDEALKFYSDRIEERFELYLNQKINQEKKSDFYVEIKMQLEKLSAELQEKNKNLELSPEEAKSEWNKIAGDFIDSYVKSFGEELDSSLIADARCLLESIENKLMMNELYDKESLKVSADSDSASYIANELADNIQKNADSIFDELFSNVDIRVNIDEKETVKFKDENWLSKFENEMDKALISWEEAETEFLEQKNNWEQKASENYSLGIEKWENAYDEFLTKKENWQNDIFERIEKAKNEISTVAQNYLDEVSNLLLDYSDILNEKNNNYYEIYCSQKETYDQVRNLNKAYKETIESWISIWKEQYLDLYEYTNNQNSIDCGEFISLLTEEKIDLNKVDSGFVSKMQYQINQLKNSANSYFQNSKSDSKKTFTSSSEIQESENDFLSFLNGIINTIENEKKLREQILSSSDKVFSEYYSPIDLEINKAEFHLQEKKREYEIAIAVNNYALSISNTTENAIDSEANKNKALREYESAKKSYDLKSENLEKEFLQKTNILKNQIEQNSDNLEFVGAKFEELIALNSEYAKAVEELNKENLQLEQLRLNLRKANAIYDYGNSIYLSKEDALENLKNAKEELELAEKELSVLKEKKNKSNEILSDNTLNKINLLKQTEERYLATSVLFNKVIEKINECKKILVESELKTNEKRMSLVYSVRSVPETSGKMELVRVTKNTEGGYEIILDLDEKKGASFDIQSFNEFFNAENPELAKGVNGNLLYSPAEDDLLNWTYKVTEDWNYFQDVCLAAFYYVAQNGYLNNVDGKNENPLDRNNTKYVLENIDPDDDLGSIGLYTSYRREALEEALRRVQKHENWQSDVARCILYKDTGSLIGENIERIETYAMNYVAYDKLYDEYEYKRDKHTFGGGRWGHRFMDSDGKLADACMDKVDDLKDQVNLNLQDVKNKFPEPKKNYELALQTENDYRIDFNRALYNKDYSSSMEFSKNDLKSILLETAKENPGIEENLISSILNELPDSINFNDALLAIEAVDETIRNTKKELYKEILSLNDDEYLITKQLNAMFKDLSKNFDSIIDMNNSTEDFFSDFLELQNDCLMRNSVLSSRSQYTNYSNLLEETVLALENNLKQKYEEVCMIEKYSEEEWENAEVKFYSDYNTWIKNYERQYSEKNIQWNESYENFINDRQEYISKNYLEQTVNALSNDSESNNLDSMINNFEFTDSSSRIQNVLDTLEATSMAFEINGDIKSYNNDLILMEDLRCRIIAEQRTVAAKLSAYVAYELLENKKAEGAEKIDKMNQAQWEWETELVRNSGYSVNENEIRRTVTDGCTLFSVLYQDQWIHVYKNFETAPFEYSVNLSSIGNLCDEAIKLLITQATNEYEQWEIKIFGSENEDGEFQKYLGDVPVLKSNVNISEDDKEDSFDFNIKGEITIILMDLQWNNLEENAAYSEFNKSPWDQKIFDASWAPTLRTTSTIAAAIAASVVSCGALSAGASAYTAAILSSSITMANEVTFATMDLAGGYKSPYEVGKSLASSAASSAIGIATAGIGDKIKDMESTVGRIGAKALFEGGKSVAGIASSSYIMSGLDFDDTLNSLTKKANYAKTIGSMICGAITSGLDEFNIGYDAVKVKGFSSQNVSGIQSFDSFVGESASSAFQYGLTGETTLNLASIKGVGLWELQIGKNGMTGKVGMNGQSVAIGRLSNVIDGIGNVYENRKINNYSGNNEVLASALRLEYGFGNENARNQLEKILQGKVTLGTESNSTDKYVAKSTYSDETKNILLAQKIDDYDYISLGLILQHEAERNGINDGAKSQIEETILSVYSHTMMIDAIAKDSLYSQQISEYVKNSENIAKDVQAIKNLKMLNELASYEEYVNNAYDSTSDFWKLTNGGTLVNDNQGFLVDEEGKYISQNGEKTNGITPDTLGAMGLETGLLNIINNSSHKKYESFTDEEILAAQALMKKAGLIPDNADANFKNYSWSGNLVGQKLNMYDFMVAAGKNVNDTIFNAHYNNSVDLVLAQRYGVDLGYSKRASDLGIPVELLGKYQGLVTAHAKETKNAEELIDKYKFEILNSDGSKTSLFKITKDNPFTDYLLGQHDFSESRSKLDELAVTPIDKWGCNFMTNLAAVELTTGTLLNKDEVIDIWTEAVQANLVDGIEAYVMDRNKLNELVSSKINNSSLNISYTSLTENDSFIAKRIGYCYEKGANKGKVAHFALGDKDGNLVYNPGFGTTSLKKYDKIYAGENRKKNMLYK